MSFLICGATGGLGSALARRLRRSGEAVHLVGRNEVKLAALAEEIGATFGVADVTDASALFKAVRGAGDQLRGLAYCVGSITLKPLARLEEKDFLTDFRINALGAALAAQAALPALRACAEGPASIVLFSTVAVAQGFAGHASIAAAKGAVEGMTRSLAAELAPKMRVNCIAPSLLDTELARPILASETIANAIRQLHPLQRLGSAEDVAALAQFLLSEEAGWVTGQIIGVDGGRASLRMKG
jgi:NAD(P)-dependent dehydrogenase (short-subunit alcohol dehydrogenase family)